MYNRFLFLFLFLAVVAGSGCRKTDFATLSNPAYLRVFNCLDYTITLDNKDNPQPFLVMLVDPQLGDDGIATGAAITGDFLNLRDAWARPYPDAGNTSVYQKEYPGTAKVLAGPTLNGYDLSSWAQVPSGKHRVLFLSRPLSTVPFFTLDKNQRTQVLVDTTIDLTEGEVYTMHVLKEEYLSGKAAVYLRNETFVKQSFSDSLVYVNFYNISSNGFYANAPDILSGGVNPRNKLRDTMNVFCSLFKTINASTSTVLEAGSNLSMGTVIRSLVPRVAPYYSFPLFADTGSNRIYTGTVWQKFSFLRPGLIPDNVGYAPNLPSGDYMGLGVGPYGNGRDDLRASVMADIRSGLIVSERSGIYNPRSFATVNTVEYINRRFFVTTIQRKFDAPVY